MFCTGTTDVGGEIVQSTCLATSPDLLTWTRDPANPLLRADPRWYEVLGDSWPGGHWRDPWSAPTATAGPSTSPRPACSPTTRFYVGRLVRDRGGAWVLLAFLNRGPATPSSAR